MTAEEARAELEMARKYNTKLAQMVMELTQKLTEASAIIEALIEKLNEGGRG